MNAMSLHRAPSLLSFGPYARWVRFLSVGALGFGVQLSVLGIALNQWSLPYLLATLLAVESAIAHNFLWHERWTWVNRRLPARQWFQRFLSFQAANGAVSLTGNLAIMFFGIEVLGTPPILTNVVAVCICAAANFLLADRWVFKKQGESCHEA